MERNFDIVDRCIELTLKVISVARKLKEANHYIIADQVIRSTSGIGANLAEGQAARSKFEFESINNIALREAKETDYWLAVIMKIGVINAQIVAKLRKENREIASIVAAIILSSKRKTRRHHR
jgi:four helix bundle protein